MNGINHSFNECMNDANLPKQASTIFFFAFYDELEYFESKTF